MLDTIDSIVAVIADSLLNFQFIFSKHTSSVHMIAFIGEGTKKGSTTV